MPRTKNELSPLMRAYRFQKYNTKSRTDVEGKQILFNLTFEQWLGIWQESGHLHERGNKKGQYCMSRFNDLGHYEVGNVHIQPNAENSRERQLRRKLSDDHKAKLVESNRRRKGSKRGA